MAATANIPIIDLSGDQGIVAGQLVEAAEEHGFIYIKNIGHDISVKDIDEAFSLVSVITYPELQKLFDAPLEEKQSCSIQTNNRGWSGMHSELLDPKNQKVGDFKEAFNFAEFINGKAQQPLPPTIAADEPQLYAFSNSCHTLCRKILHLLGVGLGIDDFFSSAHNTTPGDADNILRFLRYPPIDPTARSNDDLRAGAHSDYGSITLLFRLKGQAGLELQKKDGTWAPVPVVPPGSENDPGAPILVNIGDLLSYWTNGLFRSTVHRVVFNNDANTVQGEASVGPRYSIAFFCHPAGSVRLEPVPSDRVKNFVPSETTPNANPFAERKVLTAREHLLMRLKASYGSLYDEEKS
ncbi:hypothetical protein PT974_06886 [Cladobotryum mycophilum]|uniref:Fe2OG dioxygenase domain-containing protein n=1 Tax=Cladobotryum mycophilum TaxID=491253 RepID=A0ABR0SNW9_9HYPO